MSIVEKAMEKLKPRVAAAAERDRTAAVMATGGAVAQAGAPPTSHMETLARAARPKIVIDREMLRDAGILPPASEERRLAAECRRIKRPLVASALSQTEDGQMDAGVIMVGSAVPGEGKTFTAVNLALSLALERDASVLLVDADLPKPQISTVLGLGATRGLVDALVDHSVDVEALICDTDVPHFSILPAGRRSETATELLASQRMQDLVTRLRESDPRRIVVFDSPPLLLTTEARELAAVAGQVVLVVRAGTTGQQAVLDAIGWLGAKKRIGLVLNQVDRSGADDAYYGYADYGLSSGETDTHK